MRAGWACLGLLWGCGPGPGEPCETSGDGFSRRDPCATVCVETEVPCADGTADVPGVCAGETCTGDADCAKGQGCAAIDSFARACLPRETCPGGFAE
jgi:hypothetical protein